MSSKKAIRRERAERAKERQVRQRRESKNFRIVMVLTAVAVAAILLFAGLRGGGDQGGDRVWSEEHGHWHDR